MLTALTQLSRTTPPRMVFEAAGASLPAARLIRTVSKLLPVIGTSGVRELKYLGLEIAAQMRNPQIIQLLDNLKKGSDLLDYNCVPVLSRIIPDTLLALYCYRESWAQYMKPEHTVNYYFTGEKFIKLCLRLSKLSEAQIQEFCHQATMSGLSSETKPIWSQFSLGVVNKFKEFQLSAYKNRLLVQPNGFGILSEMERNAKSTVDLAMQSGINVEILDFMLSLGKEVLNKLRSNYRNLGAKKFLPLTEEHLSLSPIYELTTSDGQKLLFSSDLLNLWADRNHFSWLKTRELIIDSELHRSRSVPDGKSKLINPDSVRNYDRLTAMFLILGIAALPKQQFKDLLEKSVAGDPRGLISKIQVGGDQSSLLTGELTSHWYPQLKDPQLVENLLTSRSGIDLELQQLSRSVLDLAIQSSDHLGLAPNSRDFFEFTSRLRELQKLRQECLQAYNLCSLSSEFSTKLSGFFNKVQELGDYFADKRSPSGITRIVREPLAADLSLIINLIKSRLAKPGSDLYRQTGGILFNTYTEQFLQDFVNAGNYILVQDSKQHIGELDGAFLFTRPGNWPAYLRQLKDCLPLEKVSYAEEFVTALLRPSGTYNRLFRAMICCLQFEQADYSLGLLAIENLKHQKVLENLGHIALDKLVYQANLRDTLISYRPMLFRIDLTT